MVLQGWERVKGSEDFCRVERRRGVAMGLMSASEESESSRLMTAAPGVGEWARFRGVLFLDAAVRGLCLEVGVLGLEVLRLGLMISLPFPFTSMITSSSDSPNVVDRRRGDAGSGLLSRETFLRLRSYDFGSSASCDSRRISGNTSFECLKRSRSLSSSFCSGAGVADGSLRATVRLKGNALFLAGAVGCPSAAVAMLR